MADEGIEHSNAKYGSEIIHGDEKGKLLERGPKIPGAQANKRGREHGRHVVSARTELCRGYPAYSLPIVLLYISETVFGYKFTNYKQDK